MFYTLTMTETGPPKYVYKGDDLQKAVSAAKEAHESGKYMTVWVCEEVMGSTLWRNGYTLDEYGEPEI